MLGKGENSAFDTTPEHVPNGEFGWCTGQVGNGEHRAQIERHQSEGKDCLL